MDSVLKLYIIVIGIIITGLWFIAPIKLILQLLLAPRYGYKCNHISFLGLLFINENGKWICKKDKFSILIMKNIVVDFSKPIPEDIDKKGKQLTWTIYLIQSVIDFIVVILCADEIIALISGQNISVPELLVSSVVLAMIIYHILELNIIIYSFKIEKESLRGYVDSLIKKIRQGFDYANMNLKPIDQLPYQNPNILDKMLYYYIYIPYLITFDDIEGLKKPIYEMTNFYYNRGFIFQETLGYYWLIFYYSRYEINPKFADLFYERVSAFLLSDSDANAKRVLAYYFYGIKNDIGKAKQYIKEGLAVVDSCSLAASERKLERKLLLELEDIILARMIQDQERENRKFYK